MIRRDTWTRAVQVASAVRARCRDCNGWGGYWYGRKWTVCGTCNGSGSK